MTAFSSNIILFSPLEASVTDHTDHEDYYGKSDRAMMRHLPEEEKEVIHQQVEQFRMEKAKLDREVAKWDESGNDIIVQAKQMCMIMMEMTDFTRYSIYFFIIVTE